MNNLTITQVEAEKKIISLAKESKYLAVEWADGYQGKYHYIWLRDNCPQSKQQITKQHIVETASIPSDIQPKKVHFNEQQEVEVLWAHDNHMK